MHVITKRNITLSIYRHDRKSRTYLKIARLLNQKLDIDADFILGQTFN